MTKESQTEYLNNFNRNQLIKMVVECTENIDLKDSRIEELEYSLKECLDGVEELNGEFQDGWGIVIERAKQLLNDST